MFHFVLDIPSHVRYTVTMVIKKVNHRCMTYQRRPANADFVQGVTAAAIGAITGAVVVLGRRTIIDISTVLLALVTLVGLVRWKKIPEPFIVLGAAVIGLVVYSALHC